MTALLRMLDFSQLDFYMEIVRILRKMVAVLRIFLVVFIRPIARKEDLISVYQGALVSGNVNISIYFNKLANNF